MCSKFFIYINKILSSNYREAFKTYNDHKELLKDWKIFGCDPNFVNPFPKFILSNHFFNEAWLINFFKFDYCYFLEYKTTQMFRANYYYDYSVSLDTQFLSYLKRYYFCSKDTLSTNFYKILDYLIQNDINVDPFEYIYENEENWLNHKQDIFMTLYAYEVFKNVDKKEWRTTKIMFSNLSLTEINKNVNENFNQLVQIFKEHHPIVHSIYSHTYCCLLQMIILQLTYPKKSWKFKLELFLEFLNKNIGIMMQREIIMTKHYFNTGNYLRFFKKINKNMKDPIKTIKNMAWDLTHIRNIEYNKLLFTFKDVYYIPCILTYDAGLAEIIQLCKIKSVAYNVQTNNLIIVYYETLELRANQDFAYWFSHEAKNKRKPVDDLTPLIIQQEKKILEIVGV